MDAVTMFKSNVKFLGAVSEYLTSNDTCSPTSRGRNSMWMTSTRMQKSCGMASRRPSSPLATLKKEGKHESAGGRNRAPCRSVTPSVSARTNICRPSTTCRLALFLTKSTSRKQYCIRGSWTWGIFKLDDHPRSVLAEEPSTSSAGPQQTEAADCEDDSSSDGATNICPPSVSESDSEADPQSTSSDSGDCDPPNMTNLRYFTSQTFTSARHQWLCGFFQYLGLPDAGYWKKTQRLQHPSQIKTLLDTLAADEDDMERLGAENGDAVWVRWVDSHLQNKSKAPGTLTSYLTSL